MRFMKKFVVLFSLMVLGCGSSQIASKVVEKPVNCEITINTSLYPGDDEGGSCWFHISREVYGPCESLSNEELILIGKRSCESAGLICQRTSPSSSQYCEGVQYMSGVCEYVPLEY